MGLSDKLEKLLEKIVYLIDIDAKSLAILDIASFDIIFEIACNKLAFIRVEANFGFGGCEFVCLR